MKRERNDLSSLANPFSPAELEKWFVLLVVACVYSLQLSCNHVSINVLSLLKLCGGPVEIVNQCCRFSCRYDEKQRGAVEFTDNAAPPNAGEAFSSTPNMGPSKFSWDLSAEDLVLQNTIAAGSSGTVMAGAYNGLQVAIKVLHSTVDAQVLQELSREVGIVCSVSSLQPRLLISDTF